MTDGLPHVRSVVAVYAHPDDESFGLGGALYARLCRLATRAVAAFDAENDCVAVGAGVKPTEPARSALSVQLPAPKKVTIGHDR